MKLGKELGKEEHFVSSKTDARAPAIAANKANESYWAEKVRKASGTAIFSVKMMVARKALNVSLGTSNKKIAAKRAKALYLDLKQSGSVVALTNLEATRDSKLRRTSAAQEEDAKDAPQTVGWFLNEVRTILGPKATVATIDAYTRAFRCIVREIEGKKKVSCKIAESCPLVEVTPVAIKAWRDARFKMAVDRGEDVMTQNRRKRTINALVRNSKALFSQDILHQISERHGAPLIVSPFAGLKPFSVPQNKYSSKIEPALVIAAARERFRKNVSEGNGMDAAAWIIFLLGFYAGLRANETDKLQWSQVDLKNGTISIKPTDCFTAKTGSSNAEIPIEEAIVGELQWYRAQFSKKAIFVVCPDSPLPVGKSGPGRRRLNEPFTLLCQWLRNYEHEGTKPLAGVQKPIHELRKEAGSVIMRRDDIYQASLFLRHSNIQTTVNHYADSRSKKTVGLGHLLHSA